MNFMRQPTDIEISKFLPQWSWIVPETSTPLYLSTFGDWVFGNSDGSLSVLSLLEGKYERVANNCNEFNEYNKSPEWCDEIFIASWYPIAIENGIIPSQDECIGWKIHPVIGGKFEVENLRVFSMEVYQSLMSQLHFKVAGTGNALP